MASPVALRELTRGVSLRPNICEIPPNSNSQICLLTPSSDSPIIRLYCPKNAPSQKRLRGPLFSFSASTVSLGVFPELFLKAPSIPMPFPEVFCVPVPTTDHYRHPDVRAPAWSPKQITGISLPPTVNQGAVRKRTLPRECFVNCPFSRFMFYMDYATIHHPL